VRACEAIAFGLAGVGVTVKTNEFIEPPISAVDCVPEAEMGQKLWEGFKCQTVVVTKRSQSGHKNRPWFCP
jgi:hypothetical protein